MDRLRVGRVGPKIVNRQTSRIGLGRVTIFVGLLGQVWKIGPACNSGYDDTLSRFRHNTFNVPGGQMYTVTRAFLQRRRAAKNNCK